MIDLRKNLVERRMIELTPEMAEHYLTFNTYEYQREVRVAYVNILADKMSSGLFRSGEIAIVSNGTGQDIMMNGQHQCHAVIKSGETVPCKMEKFKASNSLQIAELFKQFEIFDKSQTDFVKAEAGALGIEWPQRTCSLLVSAMAIKEGKDPRYGIRSGYGGVRHHKWSTKESRSMLLRKYRKEGDFLNMILTGDGVPIQDSKHMQRAAVAFIMICTWEKDQWAAKDFWRTVRDGEHLVKKMPAKTLRDFLMGATHRGGLTVKVTKNHEYVSRSITAWNAFRKGTPTKLQYYPDKATPKII